MNKISYIQNGDYLVPDFIFPEQNTTPIGKYGRLRKKYLEDHRPVIYATLFLSFKLHEHLVETDRQANEQLSNTIQQMQKIQGITEELKAKDQMAWVGAMNNIKSCAEEIILKEIVYA